MSEAFVHMHYVPRNPNDDSESRNQHPKRQKIAVACDACRARKVRCNGARPVCHMCQRKAHKGVQCRYSDETPIPRRSPSGSQLASQESRYLYQPSRSSPPALPGASFNRPVSDGARVSVVESGQKSGAIATVASSDNQTRPYALGTTSEGPEERRAGNFASSVPVVEEDPCESQGFFGGSSSADSFITQISSAIDRKYGLNSPGSSSLSPTAQVTQQKRPSLITTDGDIATNPAYVLPPRKTADYLLEVYWTLVYPIYPFLDRQRFEEAYKSVWSGSRSHMDEKVLFGILNMVFALGCQVAGSIKPQNREEAAETYFLRAKELLPLELWSHGSTELIQCLLLMGQYLHSTNSPHSCFMIVGQAIRVAENLGFHRTGSKFDRHSTHHRELARIIWHACVMMDCIISMTFGGPTMISTSLAKQAPAPAEKDFGYELPPTTPTFLQPRNQPRMIKAFFLKSLQLYEIIRETLLLFYNDRDADNQEQESTSELSYPFQEVDFAAVMKLDQALMTWNRRLPPHLCLPQPEGLTNAITKRQAVYCRVRFLHARIILFRPVLAQFCGVESTAQSPHNPNDDSLTHNMALLCSRLCLKAAYDTISFVHSHLDRNSDPAEELPKWWFSIFYLNTAATVILAARLQPKVEDGVSDDLTDTSLARAVEILGMFKTYSQSAQRSLTALEVLSAKVRQHILRSSDRESEPLQELAGSGANGEQRLGPNVENNGFNEVLDEFDFSELPDGFDLTGFNFNLNDMSWLNSLPGML